LGFWFRSLNSQVKSGILAELTDSSTPVLFLPASKMETKIYDIIFEFTSIFYLTSKPENASFSANTLFFMPKGS